jgi:ribosomal protein S18 acetylase RimI-like enzyme
MTDADRAARLRPLHADEYDAFLAHSKESYARDIAEHGGTTEEFARRKSEADHARILPDGLETPGHWILVVESAGERVGILWLAEQDVGGRRGMYIYGVEIDEAHRRRGFGRAAMLLAEEEARSRGINRMGLNVFGANEVARNLYRSLDYVETSVQMAKDLV